MNFVFDIDDTLYDLMQPFIKAHEEMFADRASVDSTELFIISRKHSDVILEQKYRGLIPSEDAFFERVKRTYQEIGVAVSREETVRFEERYRFWQGHIDVFPFTKMLLDLCVQRKIPIAVLTNGESVCQRRKIHSLRLERWFAPERIFVSEEIGSRKPEVGAFLFVEKQLHFAPEDTWYVGDSYEADMPGAKEAGWHTIWFNHRHRACPDAVSLADIEMQNGWELLDMIREWTAD